MFVVLNENIISKRMEKQDFDEAVMILTFCGSAHVREWGDHEGLQVVLWWILLMILSQA